MKKLLYLFIILSFFSCEEKNDNLDSLKGNWELISANSSYNSFCIEEDESERINLIGDTLFYSYSYSSLINENENIIIDTLIYNLKLSIQESITVYCNFESLVSGEVKDESYTGTFYEDEHSIHYIHEETFECITFDIGNKNCFIKDNLYLKYENLGKDTLILEYHTTSFPDDMCSDNTYAIYKFVK